MTRPPTSPHVLCPRCGHHADEHSPGPELGTTVCRLCVAIAEGRRPVQLAEHGGPWVLDWNEGTLFGPFPSKRAALLYGDVLATQASVAGVTHSWNAAPLTIEDPLAAIEAMRELLLRVRCRCGRMVLEPAEGCEWHAARAELAHAREHGSVEW